MWHQHRMWVELSISPLRPGLNSLCSLVCVLWVAAAVVQQQLSCSPGTCDNVEQFKVPGISSCLSDQRKILEKTFWTQVRKEIKRLEEQRKFVLKAHHHCSFIFLLWVLNASKKISLLSVGTCWAEFRETGRSDSEPAQDFSAVLTDFSSPMLKIKLYIWSYETGWETQRAVISLSTVKGLEEISGFGDKFFSEAEEEPYWRYLTAGRRQRLIGWFATFAREAESETFHWSQPDVLDKS